MGFCTPRASEALFLPRRTRSTAANLKCAPLRGSKRLSSAATTYSRLHALTVRTAQSSALRNPVLTPAGSHSVTAKAIDDLGAETTSAARTLTVAPASANLPPKLNLTAPTANGRYNLQTLAAPPPPAPPTPLVLTPLALTFSVSINAGEANDAITQVEYFLAKDGGAAQSIGVVTASPWRLVKNDFTAGAYVLTARATDAQGATRTSTEAGATVGSAEGAAPTATAASRSFTVQATNTPSTAALSAPANNAKFKMAGVDQAGQVIVLPYTLELKASAGSPETNGTVVKVEFYAAPVTLGTPASGGNPGTPDSIGTPVLLGEDTSRAFTLTWNPVLTAQANPGFPASGVFELTAKATDDLGAQTFSAPRRVTLTPANTAPTATLSAPANNAYFNASIPAGSPVGTAASAAVQVKASAASGETNDSVTQVTLLVNGSPSPAAATLLSGTAVSGNYQFDVTLTPGIYSLAVQSTDREGSTTTSVARTVTVEAIGTNRPPTVSFSAPTNNASVQQGNPITLTVNANSQEVNGTIATVTFYATPVNAQGSPTGTAQTIGTVGGNGQSGAGAANSTTQTAAVSLTWTPQTSTTPAGRYRLSATVTDNLGAVTTTTTNQSRIVGVTAAPPPPPPTAQPAGMYFIQPDHLGTPRMITSDSKDYQGNPRAIETVWFWNPVGGSAEAFGDSQPVENPANANPAVADAAKPKFEFNLRFPGQYFDKETGLSYNYFRDYNPATGRYIESDPIGLGPDLVGSVAQHETYGYALQSPVSNSDPDGLTPPVAAGGAIVIAVGPRALAMCMRLPACAAAVGGAIKACKNVECKFERHKRHHKFPARGNQFCEHYSFRCYLKGVKNAPPLFEAQWPFPGKCSTEKSNDWIQ